MNNFIESKDFQRPLKIMTKRLRGISPLGRLFLKLVLLLFGPFIRIKNPERLPLLLKNPIIFAFNHNNSFETIVLAAALIYLRKGQLISFMIDWMYGKIPLLGLIFRQIKPVFVYSKKARWKWLEKLKSKLEKDPVKESIFRLSNNISLGIFPEGTRNQNAFRLKRGKPGLGQIVAQSNIQVLPIGIDYVQRRCCHKIPVIGTMELVIGEVMDFTHPHSNFHINHQNALNSKKQLIFSSITHQVMKALSRLCGKKYLYNTKNTLSVDKSLKKGA